MQRPMIASALCILTLAAPVPTLVPRDPSPLGAEGRGYIVADVCVADATPPLAYKITFADEPALCVQRPWRTSMWTSLDDCECAT